MSAYRRFAALLPTLQQDYRGGWVLTPQGGQSYMGPLESISIRKMNLVITTKWMQMLDEQHGRTGPPLRERRFTELAFDLRRMVNTPVGRDRSGASPWVFPDGRVSFIALPATRPTLLHPNGWSPI